MGALAGACNVLAVLIMGSLSVRDDGRDITAVPDQSGNAVPCSAS